MPRTRYNKTSNDDRSRIAQAYEDGEDFLTLAHSLGVKRTTAYSIVSTYVKEGRTETLGQRGGRQKIIDNETLDFISLLLEATPQQPLRQIKQTIREIWPTKPHFNEATLSRALEGELITLKMCRDSPAERNSESVLNSRREYAQWMMAEGINRHRIYVDETGFNLWTKRTYGRSRLGERVNRLVGGQRGRNATVICAVSNQVGILYHEVHFTTVNKQAFNHFLASLEAILGDEETVIIMDNAPVHNGMQEIYPNLHLKYLPPYSPFLNPIENCFSVLKNYMKHRLNDSVGTCTTANAHRQGFILVAFRERFLMEAVNAALPFITASVVENCYRHATSYLPRCIDKTAIYN